ncbi:MAG: hypothetical protein ABI946_03050 [Chthoniobacterales bacterium]
MTFLKKILLVDYEPGVAALVRRAFEATGSYQVKEEHQTQLTFRTRWFQPDLILSDQPPAGSVASVLTRTMQDDPALRDTPVMFVRVDDAANGGVVSGGVLSGYSFLANPVCLEELVGCVTEFLHPKVAPHRKTRDALAA